MINMTVCKYKNGDYGEVIKFESGRSGYAVAKIETVPFYDSAITFTHSLNGICTSVKMDMVYKQVFTPDRQVPNINDYEISSIVVLRPKIVCQLQSPGKSTYISMESVSEKNKDIVEKYLELKNTTLTNIFKYSF